MAGAQGLEAGLYRFFVCGTIEDEAGNLLDGGDFEVSFFRADPGNLVVNGNFDDCPSTLDPWTPTATPPNAVQTGVAGTDDFAGSPLSASAHFVQTDPASSSLEQCVPVTAESLFDLESWVRFDTPMGALAVFEQACEFFDSPSCGGTSLGDASLASLLEDVGPVWSFSELAFSTPAGAVPARCRFETGPLGGDPVFNLYVDVTVQAADGNTFSVYPLAPRLLKSSPGDVLIGVVNRYFQTGVDPPPTLPAAFDSTATQNQSYFALWPGDVSNSPGLATADSVNLLAGVTEGNFMIRGFGEGQAVPVPTLRGVGLSILAVLLAMAGAFVLWRR